MGMTFVRRVCPYLRNQNKIVNGSFIIIKEKTSVEYYELRLDLTQLVYAYPHLILTTHSTPLS